MSKLLMTVLTLMTVMGFCWVLCVLINLTCREREPTVWKKLEPKEDITAYELATALNLTIDKEWWKKLPVEMQRHFGTEEVCPKKPWRWWRVW